jgi:hypothetical protein
MERVRLHVFLGVALVACSSPKEPAPASFATPATTISASTSATSRATPDPSPGGTLTVAPAKDDDVLTKLRPDLTSCYEEGKKAIPTMTSGRITFHVAVDPSGKTACVVPSDDTGLTQDVENCMRTRLDKESYAKRDAPWSFALPLAVKDGKLGPGEARSTPPSIETIESHGLAEDVYDVVEGLLPELYKCMEGLPKSSDLRVVYVGGRVGSAGNVECALASGPSTIPAETRACAAKVLGRAKFRAPKKGYGLVSVPLNVISRK